MGSFQVRSLDLGIAFQFGLHLKGDLVRRLVRRVIVVVGHADRPFLTCDRDCITQIVDGAGVDERFVVVLVIEPCALRSRQR